MEYAQLLKTIAPCGLDCGKCLAFEHGEIRQYSLAITKLLGPNFDRYAERFTKLNPVFENYAAFKVLLKFLSEGSCGGCRKEGCLRQPCNVHGCVREKGVDYCFECDEFACERTGFPPFLYEKWRNNNITMRQLGVEGYYERIKDMQRYR
jgi:hypothetical protein